MRVGTLYGSGLRKERGSLVAVKPWELKERMDGFYRGEQERLEVRANGVFVVSAGGNALTKIDLGKIDWDKGEWLAVVVQDLTTASAFHIGALLAMRYSKPMDRATWMRELQVGFGSNN